MIELADDTADLNETPKERTTQVGVENGKSNSNESHEDRISRLRVEIERRKSNLKTKNSSLFNRFDSPNRKNITLEQLIELKIFLGSALHNTIETEAQKEKIRHTKELLLTEEESEKIIGQIKGYMKRKVRATMSIGTEWYQNSVGVFDADVTSINEPLPKFLSTSGVVINNRQFTNLCSLTELISLMIVQMELGFGSNIVENATKMNQGKISEVLKPKFRQVLGL
ncbi:hypothetical protein KBD33_01895 [Candidatus Gracilibacteria bacterium]|nr:hypothetical protein [Candidatus Gracilibacteria bacterium]